MMGTNVENKILEIINTILENRNSKILTELRPEMHLRNDIGLDSLGLAELTVRIELEYDIDIFEDGLIYNISDILKKLNIK